jgi:hypothetical protein
MSIKVALIESRKLLDFFIEDTDGLMEDQYESVRHFIEALNVGCECDDYNGVDCGCSRRSALRREALKELDKIIGRR